MNGRWKLINGLFVAIVLITLFVFVVEPRNGALRAGEETAAASRRIEAAMAEPQFQEPTYVESPEERARNHRLAECEIAISWSKAQLRRERTCEAEVMANFKRGDWGPAALRAGRYR